MIVYSRAPLRISFSGGGTDTEPFTSEHGGCVVSCTIARYAWAKMDTEGSAHYKKYPLYASSDTRLIRAIAEKFSPVSLEVRVDAPERSGLGGSGALGVAMVGCLNMLNPEEPLTLSQIAELACKAEREDLHIPGGKQDQYAACFGGGMNYMQFGDDRAVVSSLELKPDTLLTLERSLFLVFIHSRKTDDVLTDEVNRMHSKNSQTIEALSRQKELANEMRRVLRKADLLTFGELLHESWSAKKQQAPMTSTLQVDEFYEKVRNAGALGGKLSGAGGGGYFIVFALGKEAEVCSSILEQGLIPEPVVIEQRGLRVWQ